MNLFSHKYSLDVLQLLTNNNAVASIGVLAGLYDPDVSKTSRTSSKEINTNVLFIALLYFSL
jgi:hypothetical protein